MSTKKKSGSSMVKTIINALTTVPIIFGFLSKIVHLVESDARLAGRSLVMMIVVAWVIVSLLTATWISLLGMLFLYLLSLQFTWMSALAMIFLVNVVMLGIFVMVMMRLKRNLTFPATTTLVRGRR